MGILRSFLRRKITQSATVALAFCLSLVAPGNVTAQSLAGINGVVTDQTGAVVPNAKVTITNTATNISRATNTTSVGTYYITDLIPGTYSVKIEASGFKTFVSNSVNVQTATVSTVNATVQTGTTTETVEVTASPISLQTEQPQVSTTIETEMPAELPTLVSGEARQIDHLMFLAPGTTGDTFSHRINGGLDMQNEVVFNGIPVSFAETQGYQEIDNPPFDMVKEFTVQQGAFSAQYGLGQGVVQYQFKSGGNALHGDAFNFYRDSFFDAPGVRGPLSGPGDRNHVPRDHEIDYGFNLGGPVMIPKLYDGRDKTFWFFSLDHFRQARSRSNVTLPLPAFVKGDFSGLKDPTTGAAIPIYVPISWASNPSLIPAGCNPGAAPGQQFPGNIIPASCISKTTASLLPLIPAPTNTNSELKNFQPSTTPETVQPIWGFTVDHNLTTKQSIHGAYWRDKRSQPSNAWVNNPLNTDRNLFYVGTGFNLTYSNALTPHLVLTGGFQWLGELNPQFMPSQYKFPAAQPIPGQAQQYLPQISFDGGAWNPSAGSGVDQFSTSWPFSVNRKLGLTWANNWLYNKGRHTMNFGVDIRRSYQDDHECQQCAGNMHFSASTTSAPSDTSAKTSGAAFASFLLGDVNSASRQFAAESKLRNKYFAPYFQDNIKLTPKLTVNAGLRWDLAFPFTYDHSTAQVVFFDPSVPNPGAISTKTGQPLSGGMAVLGTGCTGCIGYDTADTQWSHFSPRLGFAYQLTNKTVLLAGGSFSYLDTGAFEYGTNKTAVNYGNQLNGTFSADALGTQIPGFGQWDTNSLPAPATPAFTANFLNHNGVHSLSKHINQSYDEVITAGVQRELPWNVFASVNYVHGHYIHLPAQLQHANQLDPKYTSVCTPGDQTVGDCILGQQFESAAGQAYLQSLGFGKDSNGFYSPYQNFAKDYGNTFVARALLPFPQVKSITNNFDTTGAARYDGLQASVQHRFTNGLTYLVSYTLSRTLSNADSGFSTFDGCCVNQYNQKPDFSIANDDRTHVLNISGVYELPIGPGKALLNSGGMLARNVLGGWQISGNMNYESGTPFGIPAIQDCSGINGVPYFYTNGCSHANIGPGAFNLNWNGYYTGQPIFNVAKFTPSGAWTSGNSLRSYSELRYPGNANENIALAKKFFLGERVTAELRMEYYNVLNRMIPCGNVGQDMSSSGFGFYSGNGIQGGGDCQNNTPRQGQFYLKIAF